MIDTIVQEVRDIRASIAEQFGFDRTRIIAWARAQTTARKAALSKSKVNKTLKTTGNAKKPAVTQKRRVRPVRVSV